MKALLIAEKPSLMRTIETVYKKNKDKVNTSLGVSGIDFTSQVGHLLTLKMPDEINPEYKKWKMENYPMNTPFSYKVKSQTKKTFDDIKSSVKSGDYELIIHAGDPDQEGEVLIRETLEYLKNKLPVKRFWTNDLTDGAVLNALCNLLDDNKYDPLYAAGLVRQHEDYTYGMNLTGLLSVKGGALARVGRVKGAIIRLLVDRENEIKNFVPHSDFKHAFHHKGYDFIGTDIFTTEEKAKNSFADSADITDVKETDKKQKAPKLYKLSTAQTDAYKMFGLSAAQTLSIIQDLYEKGILSYPRTDCEYISEDTDAIGIINSLGDLISIPEGSLQNPAVVMKDKTYFNNKAIAEEGHTALIPTGKRPGKLSSDESNIYFMVLRRFIAIFGENKIIHSISAKAKSNDDEDFTMNITWDIFPGYELILNPEYKMKEKPEGIKTLSKGEHIKPVDWFVKEIKAKCPPRYTNGSLVAALERPSVKVEGITYKIGTPATRANIIDDCKKAGYYTITKNQYYATDLAMKLIEGYGMLPLFDIENTGRLEKNLEDVRKGNMDGISLEKEMEDQLHEQIQMVKDMVTVILPGGKSTSSSSSSLDITCPICGKGKIIENTKAFGCSEWKSGCKATIWKNFMGAKFTKTDVKKLFEGKEVTKTVTSKAGKSWDQKLIFNKSECKIDFA